MNVYREPAQRPPCDHPNATPSMYGDARLSGLCTWRCPDCDAAWTEKVFPSLLVLATANAVARHPVVRFGAMLIASAIASYLAARGHHV